MTMFLTILLSAVGGGGLAVAIVQVWGKIKVKQLDVFVEERQQFIREVTDLRTQMNDLYRQHYKLMGENSELQSKVKELENHVNKKTQALRELADLKAFYHRVKEINDNTADLTVLKERITNATLNVFSH